MLKVLTIIGARPQIIKAAAISRAFKSNHPDEVKESLVHTGQHYDFNMSEIFFTELGIPKPDFNLNAGSGIHLSLLHIFETTKPAGMSFHVYCLKKKNSQAKKNMHIQRVS